MELAAQLRPQCRPIVAGIARQVETMLAHIADDLLVYGSGLLVIEQHGIAVGADRTVRRLPDIELIIGPALRAHHPLERGERAKVHQRLPFAAAPHWLFLLHPVIALPSSEGRREGTECVSKCRPRWSPAQ